MAATLPRPSSLTDKQRHLVNALSAIYFAGKPYNRGNKFAQLVDSREPVSLVRALIHREEQTQGFWNLVHADRLDLTVPALILNVGTPYFDLFTDEDRIAALQWVNTALLTKKVVGEVGQKPHPDAVPVQAKDVQVGDRVFLPGEAA